jgi:membrane associated rhomboid family serine protease
MYNQRQGLELTPVVKILLIANIVMYVGTTYILPDLAPKLYAYYPSSTKFWAPQIFTHMFMHDPISLFHILFNMFCLVTFGPIIEMVWKEQKFLFFYLFCGFGALGLQYAADYWQIEHGMMSAFKAENGALMGASGCLYGVMVAFAMLYPNQKIGMMFIPVYFPAKYAVPVIVAIDLFLGLGKYQTGVAHFAHLGGAISGFLLILYWWKTGK